MEAYDEENIVNENKVRIYYKTKQFGLLKLNRNYVTSQFSDVNYEEA